MKSHAEFLADFRQAEFPKIIDLTCPEEYIQKKLRAVTRAKKRTETVSTIEKGDTVVLNLASALPRFNRTMVPVTVGDGLYDAELENQLLGHSAEDTFTAEVQRQSVTVTVKQAIRTTFPEPSNAMVAEYTASQEGMEQIKTVADFRQWVIEDYQTERREAAVFAGMNACMGYALANSRWSLDEDEIEQIIQGDEEDQRSMVKEKYDLDYDQLTEEQLRQIFSAPTKEHLMQMLRKRAEQSICMMIWIAANTGRDLAKVDAAEGMTDVDWGFLENYVAGQLQIKN